MKIYKVLVTYSDCGEVGKCDAIEHEGKLWLVPHWLDNPATELRSPVRIVHLGGADGLVPAQFSNRYDYQTPPLTLSKSALEGRALPEPPIEVVESPPIEFQIPSKLH